MENEKILMVEEGEKPYNISHRCFHFAKSVIQFESECSYAKIHFSIFDQLKRSATSIGANVVEGAPEVKKKDLGIFFISH